MIEHEESESTRSASDFIPVQLSRPKESGSGPCVQSRLNNAMSQTSSPSLSLSKATRASSTRSLGWNCDHLEWTRWWRRLYPKCLASNGLPRSANASAVAVLLRRSPVFICSSRKRIRKQQTRTSAMIYVIL